MEPAKSSQQKQSSARRRHHFEHSKRPAPRFYTSGSLFGEIAKDLNLSPDKSLAELLGNQAAPGTIRKWRQGLRPAPQWAWLALEAELDRRRQELENATKKAAMGRQEAIKKEASKKAGP